jgi:hypothetical protein
MKAERIIRKNAVKKKQPAVWVGRRTGDAISRGVHFYYKAFSLPVHNAARPRLTKELKAQFAESARLEAQIRESLKRVR